MTITFAQYVALAQRTEKPLPLEGRLQHGMLGVVTEAGELGDTVKKTVIYGKPLDVSNMQEEIGDLLWYVAVLINACGLDPEIIMQANIDKLKARYPERYSDADALARADKSHEEPSVTVADAIALYGVLPAPGNACTAGAQQHEK